MAIFIKFCRLTFRTNYTRIFFNCSFLAYHNCATPRGLSAIARRREYRLQVDGDEESYFIAQLLYRNSEVGRL